MIKKIVTFSALALAPMAAFADFNEGVFTDIKSLLQDQVIPLLIVIATIVFIVGIIRYVTAGGDEEKLKAGRNMMIFGIIALAVMIAVWGIVNLLVETFGVGGVDIPDNVGQVE